MLTGGDVIGGGIIGCDVTGCGISCGDVIGGDIICGEVVGGPIMGGAVSLYRGGSKFPPALGSKLFGYGGFCGFVSMNLGFEN